MGFCRRCGDIVVGPRCKCGGTPVAPVVKWNQDDGKQTQDPWSKTYVTREKTGPTPVQRMNTGQGFQSSPASGPSTRKFPRPESQKPAVVSLDRRVSAHIASSTSVVRPPSPLKHSTSASHEDDLASTVKPEEGILPNLNSGSRLAKVYGSVLQPKESLSTFICALCSSPFPPDATIYPDPSSIRPGLPFEDVGSGTRFLCRPCFTENGGSKGDCPACGKAVLILKSEGGFVETSGKVWHKRCFCCEGCFKNIGDHPMVDLLGRPSCADCFESCLKRPSGNTPRRRKDSEEQTSNLGGIRRTNKEREGSPALDELEMRLGIRSRENTPVAESRGARFVHSPSNPTMHTPTSPPSTHTPLSKRYTTMFAGDASPTAERLAARARANSSSSVGSPSARDALSRYQSSDTSPTRNGSPLSRRSYSRLRSPDPDGGEGSPISARLTGSGSPRYGSPVSSKPPTADAIEEMKQRFLRQASPGPPSAPGQAAASSTSTTTTPTRTARRSRSHPRSSGTPSAFVGEDGSLEPQTTAGSIAPLRIVRRDNTGGARRDDTGGTAYVRRDNTGGEAYVRRDNTGGGSYVRRDNTGGTNYIRRDTTGNTDVLRRDTTGNTAFTIKPDRTGDAEVESLLGAFPSVPTGDLIDFGPDTSMSSISSSLSDMSLSRIPRPARGLTSPQSERIGLGLGLGLRTSASRTSLGTDYSSSVPPTPDLAGDFSDAATQSSGPSTPPSISPPSRRGRAEAEKGIAVQHTGSNGKADAVTPTPKSRTLPHDITIPTPLSADARCARCNLPLFSRKDGGKFVTVPEQPSSSGAPPKTYHASCFRCTVCDKLFQDSEGGRAVFVRSPKGACHVQCAPPERTITRTYTATMPRSAPATQPTPKTFTATYHHPASSSRYEPPPKTAPASQASFTFPQPRFGTSSACPGCHKAVSPMERGVVPGPQGSRWHATCLMCGGREAKGRRKEDGKPGCGKKLDSAAKTDRDGGVWCRECLLLMPATHRGSPSPTRSTPLVPSYTGSKNAFGGVAPQFTGTTTLARQFTGLGGSSDPALMRQLTGGGLSPTRQLTSSPTKMFDGPRPGMSRYPRPKSAIGFAARTKSEGGESRGMYLVRQLTGGRNKEVA
ncbi:uncharacterized protein TRAVEDRAFT_62249 [Trametes versicolor FP-101664 SS1]|uniref:uncharacterized protein n=1 Tax=Trametes versicolor (strain FP-101664) TaxID=717944 RepID=UPI00046236CE|nr:uncharacterized protein TRAVEDRAFT_62249 [Trametes versicolor FP-101664 SS1]EIW64809.1 hypothetical protein TRAVEDRAFT_62249 [Trametes versicolor FP-101664 SS1]